MSARCKWCDVPLTDVAGLIAKATALLDLEVPLPSHLALPPQEDGTYARVLEYRVRMGAAEFYTTESLAIANGFCGAHHAHAHAHAEKTKTKTTTEQETSP